MHDPLHSEVYLMEMSGRHEVHVRHKHIRYFIYFLCNETVTGVSLRRLSHRTAVLCVWGWPCMCMYYYYYIPYSRILLSP